MRSDPPFAYRLHRPDAPDGSTLVLLHGTGGDETDLLPLGARIAPGAALLGLRGRSSDEGALRWFRRLTATRFDQQHILAEAQAFAAFLPELLRAERLDPARTTLLGYSNGANFIAAVMLLSPHLVRRAALLRPMLVLEAPPAADLSDAVVLTVAGRSDPYGPYAPLLNDALRTRGAHVEARLVQAGHELGPDDMAILREWLAAADEGIGSSGAGFAG